MEFDLFMDRYVIAIQANYPSIRGTWPTVTLDQPLSRNNLYVSSARLRIREDKATFVPIWGQQTDQASAEENDADPGEDISEWEDSLAAVRARVAFLPSDTRWAVPHSNNNLDKPMNITEFSRHQRRVCPSLDAHMLRYAWASAVHFHSMPARFAMARHMRTDPDFFGKIL